MNKIVTVGSLFLIVTLQMKANAVPCDAPTYCTGPAMESGQCQPSNQPSTSSCSCSDLGPSYVGNAVCSNHYDAGPCGNGDFCLDTVSCDYTGCSVSATPPPPAPTGTCPVHTICGKVYAQEGGSALSGMRIELKSSGGQTVQSVKTALDGSYSFTVADGTPYIVMPTVGRLMGSVPQFLLLTQTFSGNFSVRGVTASVHFSGLPTGTFVLLSLTAYQGNNPPNSQPGNHGSYWTGVSAGENGLTLNVPAGNHYFATCWEPNNGTFLKMRSASISETVLAPKDSVQASCQ